jgi:hypothetical protein
MELQFEATGKTRSEMSVETAGKRHRSLAAASYTRDAARLAYSPTPWYVLTCAAWRPIIDKLCIASGGI